MVGSPVKMKVKKGDEVVVLAGRDKGKKGEGAADCEGGAVLELHDTTLRQVLEQHSEDALVLPDLRFSEVLGCVEAHPRSVCTELAERYAGYQHLA